MDRIQDQLRALLERSPGVLDPYWLDEARRLMRQAADALDAADAVLTPPPTQEG